MSGTDFNKGKSSSMKATYNIDNPNLPYQTNLELWQTSFGLSAGGWLNAISLYGRIGWEAGAWRLFLWIGLWGNHWLSQINGWQHGWGWFGFLAYCIASGLALVQLSCWQFGVNCFRIFLVVPFSLVSFVKQIFLKKRRTEWWKCCLCWFLDDSSNIWLWFSTEESFSNTLGFQKKPWLSTFNPLF